jgi:hypothetical protein
MYFDTSDWFTKMKKNKEFFCIVRILITISTLADRLLVLHKLLQRQKAHITW